MKGQLLRIAPYTVTQNGVNTVSVKIVLSPLTCLRPGNLVYQEKLEDGTILLIPEKIYLEREKK